MSCDVIVVGSGATGSQAAQTLVEAGKNVTLLDVGFRDNDYAGLIPAKDFTSIRQEDSDQHLFFLGRQFESLRWDDTRVGSQLTPPRSFLVRGVDKWLPVESATFKPMESLATGGLGGGWGTGCYVFSKLELEALGLDEPSMQGAYQVIADRIGVSGAADDAQPYCLRDLQNIQLPVAMERNLQGVLGAYGAKKHQLNKRGIVVGRSALAVLTQDKDSRTQQSYRDMDFWSDRGGAAYRSWMTIDALRKHPNFTYNENCLVLRFLEDDTGVQVVFRRIDTNEESTLQCRKLVLAPSALGTARIVSRSFNYQPDRLPLICNPYSYVPCLQWRMLGRPVDARKTSFSPLVMYLDENRNNFDVGVAALFSYRSLLLFKLIKEAPLNYEDGRIIMQYLQSAFTIAGIHHPELPSASKFVRLVPSSTSPTGDVLQATYLLSDAEQRTNARREKKLRRALRSLGCTPLKTIRPPHGASIHYAGTLPFSTSGAPFTLHPDGRLAGTKNVFVADGSGFKYLPAKGLTFTLMANAHRVASNALKT